ncbi:MAG: metallophosphoesterase [Methanolinea sp.]|nr:metallophosphoesterase [Methanolinea sp.]
MKLEFIADGPALLVNHSQKVLVAADLHLGIEQFLSGRGVHIRSHSRERIDRLTRCISAVKPDMLVLLGDVKHSVPFLSRQEQKEIPGFLEELRALVPLVVLPGNHDPGLEEFLCPGEVLPREGAIIDGIGYIHGHTYPHPDLQGHLIVSGHHHILVTVCDEVGCSLRSAGYLLARGRDSCLQFPPAGGDDGAGTRVLFMPAFNELAGYDVVRIARDPISPLSRCIDTSTSEVFLADGTFIGPLSSLEENGADTNSR